MLKSLVLGPNATYNDALNWCTQGKEHGLKPWDDSSMGWNAQTPGAKPLDMSLYCGKDGLLGSKSVEVKLGEDIIRDVKATYSFQSVKVK